MKQNYLPIKREKNHRILRGIKAFFFPLAFLIWGTLSAQSGKNAEFISHPVVLSDPTPFLLGGPPCASAYLSATIQQGDSLFGCREIPNILDGFDSLALAYIWSTGETTSQINIDTTGNYFLVVFDSLGCRDTAFVYVFVGLSAVDVDAILPDTLVICKGDTGFLDAYDPNIFAWVWTTTETTSSIEVTQLGYYTVVVYDSTVCTDTATVFVYPSLTDVNLDSLISDTSYFCRGDTFRMDILHPEIYAYLWSTSSTQSNIELQNPGLFNLIIYDSTVCTDTAWFRLIEMAPQVYAGPDTLVCPTTPVTLNATGPFISWSWSTGTTNNPIVVNNAGTYIVVAIDSAGCYDWDTVVVNHYPGIAIPVITQNVAVLTSSSGPFYQWYQDSILIPGATSMDYTPVTSGVFMVEVYDANGCNAFSNPYNYEFLAIPEGISPNGDGFNDFWVIPFNTLYPANHLEIMNRWGSLVYDREPYDNNFEGMGNSGSALPDGTYYFIYDKGNGEEKIQGFVIINR